MPIFDWGTYNGLSKLRVAELLGTRLTEIPPRIFMRKTYESYFREYKENSKFFTTITAHAPYYSLLSYNKEVMERSIRAMRIAVKNAVIAGAEIFNMHIGVKVFRDERDIELVANTVKEIMKDFEDKIYFSLETTYAPWMLGSFEEIRAIIETIGSDKVIVSPQLENVFMYETALHSHGKFEQANKQATKDFWLKVLTETLRLSKGYFSLRFSQITGIFLGNKLLKKRVPLGRGYPDIEPLADALAEFMVKEIHDKNLPLEIHLIYTGPPETKFQDTVTLYSEIMRRVFLYLK